MSKRILITGGTGFVGSHCVEAYLKAGWTVRALVRDLKRPGWLLNLPIEFAAGTLTDEAALTRAVHECDAIVHCAGLTKTPDAREFYRINADAVESFTRIARESGVRRFILCSTQAAAGPCITDSPVTESDPPHPISDYGRSKLEGELRLQAGAGDMDWIILRPPAIMGPRDEQFLALFRTVIHYRIYPRFGAGNQRYSFIGVHDFVRALLAAGTVDTGLNEVYFCAGQETLNWSDASRRIAELAGRRAYAVPIGTALLKLIGFAGEKSAQIQHKAALINRDKVREFLAGNWICSSEKIRNAWGFECEQSIDTVLRLTYESYRNAGRL